MVVQYTWLYQGKNLTNLRIDNNTAESFLITDNIFIIKKVNYEALLTVKIFEMKKRIRYSKTWGWTIQGGK